MRLQLIQLMVQTKRTPEIVDFAPGVTFLHGPIGRGKSTVARLIDYCLGGELERTPAIQQEFLSARLSMVLGDVHCTIERAAEDTSAVRVNWIALDEDVGSLHVPLKAQELPILGDSIHNLSDLLFHFAGVAPIKVRKRTRDPDSPLIRLSFRDVWWYCYLDQTHLDSSFFRLEDPFRGRKSQDAMRFFTGLHSERLSQFETELFRAIDDQRAKRDAVVQIRNFMSQFGWSSDLDLAAEIQSARDSLAAAEARRGELEVSRQQRTHPTDSLRHALRRLGDLRAEIEGALTDSQAAIAEQSALRAELITAKLKSSRVEQAGQVLEGVEYERCPQCGNDLTSRPHVHGQCRLCLTPDEPRSAAAPVDMEVLRRDLNERIDQIGDSIARRQREVAKMQRQLGQVTQEKETLDAQLQQELVRYDSAFVEAIRAIERETATFSERIKSLLRLQQMPQAITSLEEQAGALQGRIDMFRYACEAERERLKAADENVQALATEFKRLLLEIGFPGMSEADEVVIDPRNWQPMIVHGEQQWSFWDTGSGGKKTLFNVCYMLSLHRIAALRNWPVPSVLVIDSPTKNISDDENPELVQALYGEIYRIAGEMPLQFLLIDSHLVAPPEPLEAFIQRRMAGEAGAPSLISYYVGP